MSNCIVNIFENTVLRFPNRTAVADEQHALSFSELKKFSQKIANRIENKNTVIGVMAHRDVFTIPMFLGVTYSGRCYVPIDPEMPVEKIRKIVESAGIKTVMSCELGDKEKIESAGAEFLQIASNMEDTDTRETLEIKECDNQELLYLIYTSGSTGMPKGVAKSYKAMESFIDAYQKEFAFDEHTIIGNQTPFCFDASAKDIYMMAACGATLEILPTTLFSFPVRLVEYMNARKINFISWVPSALTIVTTLNTFTEIVPKYLKKVFFVGEVFAAKHLNKWMDALPDAEFVNLYGSSEICGISCFYRIKEKIDVKDSIPVGGALSNCDVRLIHDGMSVETSDVSGEIYVASQALADGYFGDPTKTEQSFVFADFGDGEKRYYRTGDVARYNENGELVFMARSDYQIKHMGHRIELGEIETAAMAMKGLEKCCCLYDNKRSRMILYAQLEAESKITAAEIRSELKASLSDYMVPHRVKILEKLPLNTNGKIDRPALQRELQ